MNKQREVVYTQRRDILEGVSLKENILGIIDKVIEGILAIYAPENLTPQEWDMPGFASAVKLKFGIELGPAGLDSPDKEIKQSLEDIILREYAEKEKTVGQELMRHLERMVFLQIIDAKWKDHLYAMDSLREGIGLRAYGQRDPLIEYKHEAFQMFSQMISGIEDEAVEMIFKLQPARQERLRGVFSQLSQQFVHPEAAKFQGPQEQEAHLQPEEKAVPSAPQKSHPKVGRNEPCPCGSGKKYKKCCGK